MKEYKIDVKKMWEKCKVLSKDNCDINSGGLGRLKIRGDNRVFVGGFYLNMTMLFDGKQGYIKYTGSNELFPCNDISLTAKEFVESINK